MEAKAFTFSTATHVRNTSTVRSPLRLIDAAVAAHFFNASQLCNYVCAPASRDRTHQSGNVTFCSNVSVTRRMLSFASPSVVPCTTIQQIM